MHSTECKICISKSGRPKKIGKRKLSMKYFKHSDSETDSAPECQDELNSVVSNSDFQALSNSSFVSNISGSENDPSSGSDVDTVTLKGLSLQDNVNENIVTFGDVVIESLNVDRFVDPQIVEAFVCTICRGIPFEPIITSCNHSFCSSCIRSWIRVSSACPVCRFCIDETDSYFYLFPLVE